MWVIFEEIIIINKYETRYVSKGSSVTQININGWTARSTNGWMDTERKVTLHVSAVIWHRHQYIPYPHKQCIIVHQNRSIHIINIDVYETQNNYVAFISLTSFCCMDYNNNNSTMDPQLI